MSESVGPHTALSPEQLREVLAERLRRTALGRRTGPLSFGQQRLWFLEQLEPNTPRYNMPSVARLRGRLDQSALQRALNTIFQRHEALRARFLVREGEPVVVFDDEAKLELVQVDLSTVDAAAREEAVERLAREEVARPFNLSADRLIRATLLRLEPDDHVLILVLHHIITDEWSFKVLFQELGVLYEGLCQGKPVALAELPIQYSDYAVWQQEWLDSKAFVQQLAFWKRQLEGAPASLELPTDRRLGSVSGAPGASQTRELDGELSDAIRDLARRERATLFLVLLAALKTLFYRYTGQENIIVGSPVAGRRRLETEPVIGFFVNTLPLRTRMTGDLTFQQLLALVRDNFLDAFSYQDVPFEKMVEAVHPERAPARMPFVNTMFMVQPDGGEPVSLPGLDMEFLDVGTRTAKFDLLVVVQEQEAGLNVVFQYNAAVFQPGTMERWLGHFENLLRGIVAQPAQKLSELPLLSPEERHQLLVDWNSTQSDYPRNRCVHELFEAQALQRPEAVALVSGRTQLTYGELNARANQLAHHLRHLGVTVRSRVGVCFDRSLDMVVALLAVLKTGAAYAPLDPGLPAHRMAEMLEDLQVPVLITHQRKAGHGAAFVSNRAGPRGPAGPLSAPGGEEAHDQFQDRQDSERAWTPKVICLETDAKAISRQPTDNLCCESEAEDLAYISFTSGSTGRPKGVCVPHRAIVRLVRNNDFASFSPTEVFLHMASISFDASLFEIWGSLLNGARLVVAPPHVPSLAELGELIRKQQITTAWFTAGFFNQIVEEAPEILRGLRQVLTGGDVVSPPHVKKALAWMAKESRLVNGYGPTENGTFTACYPIPADFDGDRPVPIGRPIANTQCYVLDSARQLVPVGVPGELYAGGDGLALGYLNRPALTAEKFVPHPFQPGARLYRTGDLVRYLPDGNLEFLGRLDTQVKIRGFRVEPGEIESVLLEHPAVGQCVVVARPDAAGVKQLVAYVVPRRSPPPAAEELREFLRGRLPPFMLPAFFVSLPELPLSRNGKVDRLALPSPDSRSGAGQAPVAPRDSVEAQLQPLWEETLGVKPIGVRDQFFALGGHSLLAVRLLARIEKSFGRKLPVVAIFQHPTIEQLAALLRQERRLEVGSHLIEIQPKGAQPPLLLVPGAGGGMFWGYGNLARHLGPNQPVYAFKARGLEGLPEQDTIEELAATYLEDLRQFQPQGPYFLGGYCFGGLIAYEMARCLEREGESVALLALINSNPPNSSYVQFRWTPVMAFKFGRNLWRKACRSLWGSPGKWREATQWRARMVLRRLRRFLSRSGNASAVDEVIDPSQYPPEQRQMWEAHLRALSRYQPQPYRGRITLFRSPLHLLYCSFDEQLGWGDFALGGVTLKLIPGAHDSIMEEPEVRRLAVELKASLTEAQARVSNLKS